MDKKEETAGTRIVSWGMKKDRILRYVFRKLALSSLEQGLGLGANIESQEILLHQTL